MVHKVTPLLVFAIRDYLNMFKKKFSDKDIRYRSARLAGLFHMCQEKGMLVIKYMDNNDMGNAISTILKHRYGTYLLMIDKTPQLVYNGVYPEKNISTLVNKFPKTIFTCKLK